MPANVYVRSASVRIVASGIASVGLSVGAVWLMGRIQKTNSIATGVAVVVVFLLSFVLPQTTVAQALYHSFRAAQPPRIQIRLIIISYFMLIVVFSGVYFSMQFVGDYNHAANNYLYYRFAGEDLQRGRIETINPYPKDMHAFVGMNDHLWTTIDDQMPLDAYRSLSNIDRYRAELASRHDFYHLTNLLFLLFCRTAFI